VREQATNFLLGFYSELMYSRNTAFSQPYLSRHPWVHLRRGETKAFLKAYYTGLASLADRETYSWWEHYFHVSPHKTHEEASFLLQTRWMLYLEEGDTLSLLRGVPRAWLSDGQNIELRDVRSYFGPLTLEVNSQIEHGRIEAKVICDSDRRPRRVELRVPHPRGQRASSVEGGSYDADREVVIIDPFSGRANLCVRFETS
jgi:hypothetical protein